MAVRLVQIVKSWVLPLLMICSFAFPAISSMAAGIHHGRQASNTTFPFFVGLTRKADGRYRCGGTLISRDTVLTAAHCVYDYAPQLIANVGMDGIMPFSALESVPVKKTIIYGKYGAYTEQYDIALLKLAHAVTATHAYMALAEWNVASHADVYAIGFGLTEKGYSPGHLLEARYRIIDWYEHCSGHNYPRGYPPTHFDPHYHLCTQPNTDSGDSGGPVMNFHDGRYYQVGIVSTALLGAAEETRVSAYYDWINAHK